MTRYRTVGIWVSTAAIAAMAAGAAIGGVYESTAPQIASMLSLTDGFARSRLAFSYIAQTAAQNPAAEIQIGTEAQSRIVRLSREAYSSEPLNADALRNLALAADAAGQEDRAYALMQLSLNLSKRDLATNGWFIQYYIQQGDEDNALRSFDRAMRTSNRGRATFIDALLTGAAQDGMARPLMALLSDERPVWERQFWLESSRFPTSSPNLARVRIQRARDGFRSDPRTDQALLDNLVRMGEFELASSLHDALVPSDREPGEHVRNARFSAGPQFRPFDWQLQFDNFILPSIDNGEGLLRVEALGNANGLVARQLVKLEDQVHHLSVVTQGWNGASSEGFSLRLDCVESGRGGQESRALPINAERVEVDFRKPDAECVFYWLNLYINKASQTPESTLGFDEISITSRS